jgi:MULE transposase domain
LVIGTSDYDRKFHPFGLAVCCDEKQADFEFIFNSISSGVERIIGLNFTPEVLITDGSGAIRNAFVKIFNNNNIVMCWSHTQRNIEKKLKGANKNEILDDVDKLQLCESEIVFRTASSLFLKKWNKVEKEFTDYFENEWLKHLDSWYEGYSNFTPSTNNSLEATNKVIKDEHTFRERHPLARFLTIADGIVSKWSTARNQDQTDPVVFSTEPTITLKKWTDSYHFAKCSKTILQIPSKKKHLTDYYIPAGTKETMTRAEIEKYNKKKWTSFDQFKDLQFGIWKLTLPNNGSEWTKGICNCPNFFKEYICKHVIGMAIRLKFCKPPPAAKDVPLGEKRKRGRPRKATKALLID